MEKWANLLEQTQRARRLASSITDGKVIEDLTQYAGELEESALVLVMAELRAMTTGAEPAGQFAISGAGDRWTITLGGDRVASRHSLEAAWLEARRLLSIAKAEDS